MSTIDKENNLGITFCERLPLAFTHGQGTRVWDEAGLLVVATRNGIIRLLPDLLVSGKGMATAKMILEHVLHSCQA